MARISKKQKDAQTEWESKISRALKVKKNYRELFQIDKARLYFDGKQRPTDWAQNEWITVNKILSYLQSRLPTLYAFDPYFYVKLKRSFNPGTDKVALAQTIQEWDAKGKIRSSFLNYTKVEQDLKGKARLGILDAHFEFGVLKTRFAADSVENENAGQPVPALDSEGNATTRINEETGDEITEFLTDENGNQVLQPDYIPINERYVTDRIHPDDFIFDEDAGPLEDDWKWLGQRIVMPYDDLKEDKRLNRAVIKSLKGTEPSKTEEQKQREIRKKGNDIAGKAPVEEPAKKDKPKNNVELWEIYDIKNRVWHIFSLEADAPLLYNEPLPKGVEKHPYSILVFMRRDDSPYPHPPISPGLDLQDEYNLTRSRMVTHRKRFNRKYEADMQALGADAEDELSKLESGDDGTILRKKGGASGMTAITPIKDAPLDQQTTSQEVVVLNRELAEALGGQTMEARGIAGSDSATEAGILDRRLSIKEGDALSMVVDWLLDWAKKTDQLVQANITRDEAVKIVGPEGEKWEIVRTSDYEDIAGEFEYSANAGATIPRIPQTEWASFQAILKLFAEAPFLMTSERLVKKVAEMHHMEDEALVNELLAIAERMIQSEAGGPLGSEAGVSEERPGASAGGMAGGSLSLNQPGAGNLEG